MINRRKTKAARRTERLRRTARDTADLRYVGRSGIVEIDGVAEWLWGGTSGAESAACRRFRDYVDHGYMRVWIRDLRQPNRYTITEAGADWAGIRWSEGQVLRTKLRGDTAGADHVVLAARLWAAIGRRLSEPDAPILERFVTEGEIRHVVHGPGVLIPDGIAVLGGRETGARARPVFGVAIEVDLGNERTDIIAAKLRKYQPFLIEARPFLGMTLGALLIVAPGVSRIAMLAMEAQRAGLGARSFFLDAASVEFRTVLDRLATITTLVNAANGGGDPFTVSLLEVVP